MRAHEPPCWVACVIGTGLAERTGPGWSGVVAARVVPASGVKIN